MPWQVGQTVSFAFLSRPVPLHSSQGSKCLILISFSKPKQASRKSISISSLKSSPRCALFELEPYPSEYPKPPPKPPPKNDENISDRSISPISKALGLNPALAKPSSPYLSYISLFLSSDKVS